jgi:hypothetical protein
MKQRTMVGQTTTLQIHSSVSSRDIQLKMVRYNAPYGFLCFFVVHPMR